LKFFCNRVVDVWNRLPDSIVTAESVSSFKRRLNSFDSYSFISYECIFLFRERFRADCCQPWRPCLTFRPFIAYFLLYVFSQINGICGLSNTYHIISRVVIYTPYKWLKTGQLLPLIFAVFS
jgi:hypothetical protein